MDDDKPQRPRADWEAIEREYRAGQLSVAEIARQHSISPPAIFKRARQQGWTRNYAERIREEVTARAVTDGVTGVTARETIELAAERGVQIVRDHRKLIGRGRSICERLFGELEEAGTGDDAPSLKDKATAFGTVTGALKTLIGLERQAFNLGDEGDGDNPDAPRIIEWRIVDPKEGGGA